VEQDATESSAALATGTHGGEDSTLESDVLICIRHDYSGIVTPKFENGASKALVDNFTDLSSDSSRSSERNEGNSSVISHGHTNVSSSREHGHYRFKSVVS